MVLIAATYAYIAVEENDLTEDMNPPHEITCKVFSNIFLSELIFWILYIFGFSAFSDEISFTNLLLSILVCDMYYFTIHKFLFHGYFYNTHRIHHDHFISYAAWNTSIFEHILLKICSILFSFYLFPNNIIIILSFCLTLTYFSVISHTKIYQNAHQVDITPTSFGLIGMSDYIYPYLDKYISERKNAGKKSGKKIEKKLE